MKWISVKDRLPELEVSLSHGFTWESEQVLVWSEQWSYSPQCILKMSLYANKHKDQLWWWEYRHGHRYDFSEITHWMPLPEPPDQPQE